MRDALACIFAVVAAVPLFAQATITIEIGVTDGHDENLQSVPVGTDVIFQVSFQSDTTLTSDTTLELDIPGVLVHVASASVPCTGGRPIRCTLGTAGDLVAGSVSVTARLDTPGTQTAVARVPGTEVTRSIEVVNLPSVTITAGTSSVNGQRVEPGELLQYRVLLSRSGATPTNVRVRYTLPDGGTFTSIQRDVLTTCDLVPHEIVCTIVVFGASTSMEITARAPEHSNGGTFVMRAEVTHDQPDFDPGDNLALVEVRLVRPITVTNMNDEGSGSLRQALLDAQTLCADQPCSVLFRIPGTAPDGVFAITPKSPLPEVRGWVKIDGSTQEGAHIALLGHEAGLAHGLLLGEGCEFQVRGLTISGFAWPGIEVQRTYRGGLCDRARNGGISPPILIAGNRIRENYRGIVLVESDAATIRDNVVERNTRAGIFVDRTSSVDVLKNRVVDNGASGMFFNVGARGSGLGAHVYDNVVANNREWGITRTDGGWVAIQRNSIFGNVHPAIDVNLDFETPNRADDDFNSIPNKPTLISAHYDPAQGMTFVTGRVETNQVGAGIELDFYVDSHPTRRHLEEWVASFPIIGAQRQFTFGIPANLKGSWLVATSTRTPFFGFAKPPGVASDSHNTNLISDTSEVSNAVPVQ